MEIVSLIISVLSLIATIAVSFTIYWLQRRHEKELVDKDEQYRTQTIKERAKNFIIDNEDELYYLPLCIVSSSLHSNNKHSRKIYERFNRCTYEIKEEILKQAKAPYALIKDGDWLDDCLASFIKDRNEFNLGKDFLYDNAKYFKRAFTYHKDEEMPINILYFSFPKDDKLEKYGTIEQYINEYIYEQYSAKTDTTKTPKKKFHEQPFTYIWNKIIYSINDEKFVCAWVLNLVAIATLSFNNYLYSDKLENDLDKYIFEGEIATLEDYYYLTALYLYITYWQGNRKK